MRLPQARRTWHSLFGESTLPILETSAEWTAWAQQTIDETEAQVNKVGHSPADVRGAPLGTNFAPAARERRSRYRHR